MSDVAHQSIIILCHQPAQCDISDGVVGKISVLFEEGMVYCIEIKHHHIGISQLSILRSQIHVYSHCARLGVLS